MSTIKDEKDPSTEERIKAAAREVFQKKGFSGARIRDIAEKADINLALLNYYFRSKQKLFELIMLESMQEFLKSLKKVLEESNSSLSQKMESMVNSYIDLLTEKPDIPLFILTELRRNPDEFVTKMGIRQMIIESHFIKQFQEGIQKGEIAPINPLHFIMNLLSMTVFPFIASPMIKGMGNLSDKEFHDLMTERRNLIPMWIAATMKK